MLPIKHDEIVVYEKLRVVHMNNQLLRPHLNLCTFKKMLEDRGPDEYKCVLVGITADVSVPYTFFVRPNRQDGRPVVFCVMMGVECTDCGRIVGFDASLLVIQRWMQSQAHKRWMQRFLLATRHGKSKLLPLLERNHDILHLILEFYCSRQVFMLKL